MQPIARLLKLGAAALGSLLYVWFTAVRHTPEVKRRKARRRKARREELARR
jgi:hypothetical protein